MDACRSRERREQALAAAAAAALRGKKIRAHEGARWFSMPLWGTALFQRGTRWRGREVWEDDRERQPRTDLWAIGALYRNARARMTAMQQSSLLL